MDFSTFGIEWLALIVSLVALLMGIPALLQRRYGAPEIDFTFEAEEAEDYHYLSCAIYNRPIVRGLLKELGVRREMAQDVIASFKIYEQGTNREICTLTETKIKIQQGVAMSRIALPASVIPARIVVVYYKKQEGKVRVSKEKEQVLPLGAYMASIGVMAANKLHTGEHRFVVSDNYPFAEWRNY